MSDAIVIDVDALRSAVAARNYRRGLIFLARQLDVSENALFSFSRGLTWLAPDVLQRLAGLVGATIRPSTLASFADCISAAHRMTQPPAFSALRP